MLKIKIHNINYRKKNIIDQVDIEIFTFGLFGFFGKNGAGKTSFLKTFIKNIAFNGEIKLKNASLSEKKVAWIPTEPFLYEYLTIKEFCDFYAYTVKGDILKNNYFFDIENSKLLKECSTGTKKKAYINAVLQFDDYDIYIFDEPFNGLDIESNYLLLNKIIELSKNNIVLISSHIIEIIEPYLTEKFYIGNSKIEKIHNLVSIKNLFKDE